MYPVKDMLCRNFLMLKWILGKIGVTHNLKQLIAFIRSQKQQQNKKLLI